MLSRTASSSVTKNWPFSISFEKPALEQSLINFFCSRRAANFSSYSANSFPCALTSVWALEWATGTSARITIESKFSSATGFSAPPESLDNSKHRPATAPRILSCLTERIVRRSSSVFSSQPLKWMDFFPHPLLFNSPLSKGVEVRKIRMLAVGEFGQHHICDQIPFSIRFLDVSTVPLLFPSGSQDRPMCSLKPASVVSYSMSICNTGFSSSLLYSNQCHCTLTWRWSFLWIAQVHTATQRPSFCESLRGYWLSGTRGIFFTRVPSVLHRFDPILWNNLCPETIGSFSSKYLLVQYSYLPSTALSPKRCRSWRVCIQPLCR